MATQVSYPGVYIEEYAPAAPIEGVSTSIAAFIGIAEKGVIGTPTFVTSLDAFTAEFGGSLAGPTPAYLPLAVQGFFRNGGTMAYVIRVGTATPARAELKAASGPAAPALGAVVAKVDGAAGDGGAVTITNRSPFAAPLAVHTAGVTAAVNVTAIDPTRRVLTVSDSSGFAAGDVVVLTRGATTSIRLTVAAVAAGTVSLTAAAPANAPEWNRIRTADLAAGDTRFRVDTGGTSLRASTPAGSVIALTKGATTLWGVAAEVTADSITLASPLTAALAVSGATMDVAEFDVTLVAPDGTSRTYPGRSTSPSHPRWWGTVDDPYARVVPDATVFPPADPRPAGIALAPVTGATPDDPAAAWAKVASDIEAHLALLEPIDDVSLVVVPGLTDTNAQARVVEHCERCFDRFAILDAAAGGTLDMAIDQRTKLTGTLDKGFAALYYPWITVGDPVRNPVVPQPQPPSGHLAGIYARTDATRGVHKAPANIGIAGAAGLERPISDTDNGRLNLNGVNALRTLPGRGSPTVWGARTTAGDTNWRYINIRRLFLYLEESIQEGLSGSVFEPNDLALWQRLKRTITEFLTRVWRDGALFGATAKDAFFVRIDEALNPPSTRKLGRLYIEIGVQPVYPAEFIVVRIGIWDGGAEVAEV
jgi:phage tail sheath protein FI